MRRLAGLHLRMPLNADAPGVPLRLHRLDHAVLRPRHRVEPIAQPVDRLVMPRAHVGRQRSENIREPAPRLHPHGVPGGQARRKPVRHLVAELVGHVPVQGPPAQHVQHLHAPADAEHGQLRTIERRPRQRNLEAVALGREVVEGLVRRAAVGRGIDVVGARTTESQTHREMASGLSTPVGFKNGTDGSLDVAINALKSARQPHHFLGINQEGRTAVIQDPGQRLRSRGAAGRGGPPNYDSVSIALCERELAAAGLPERIVVDCSHANSNKDHNLQPLVARDCIDQLVNGNHSIIGLMLESHLHAGNQKIGEDRSQLAYGVSVTDACIDWETTVATLREAARAPAAHHEAAPGRVSAGRRSSFLHEHPVLQVQLDGARQRQ